MDVYFAIISIIGVFVAAGCAVLLVKWWQFVQQVLRDKDG